jgi:hypothetical protein
MKTLAIILIVWIVQSLGPATVAPVILDSNLVAWTLTVDTLGDITATS